MIRRLSPVLVMLAMFAGSSAKGQMPFPNNLVPTRSALERLGLERQWYAVLPLLETERLLRISRSSDLLFAQTNDARLHVIDPESGRVLWTASSGERAGFARGAASNSFAVFITTANYLFAFDKKTGRQLWKFNLGTIPTTSPDCDDDLVTVGMTDGMIEAFKLRTLDDKGNASINTAPVPAWNWHAGSTISTRPLVTDKIVAFGGGDSKVYIVESKNWKSLFRISTGGPIGEGLGTYGTSLLLVPSADYNLYALDIFTATIKWVFPSGAPFTQEPLVCDADIIAINNAGNVFHLDPNDGKVRWSAPTPGGHLMAVSGGKVYLRSDNLDLLVLDRATGRQVISPSDSLLRAGLDLRSFGHTVVNRFNDRLYFASDSGMIVCLREIGQPKPRPNRDPKALPFAYIPVEGIVATPPPVPSADPAATDAKPDAFPAPDAKKEKEDSPQ
jgi:outer membrane protein assembly factor BamB